MTSSLPIAAGHREVPWVIIDGDCAFCSSSTSWLADRLHRPGSPDARRVPYQFLVLESFGLTVERTRREMIWLPAGDEVPERLAGGADAFAAWLCHAGTPYAALGRFIRLPVINSLAWLIYRLVSANRQRLPGGTPACSLPPQG